MFVAIIGTAIAGALGAFGDKPTVPPWHNVRLPEMQQQAISANQSALPGAQQLTSDTNRFNMEEINRMLEFSIPNYDSLTTNMSNNIDSLLRGEIPSDVSQKVQTNAAVKALMGGFGGSGMHGSLMARDLGLTSLDLMGRGEDSLTRWTALNNQIYSPGLTDVSSMFISPQQQFQATFQNQQQRWNRSWLNRQVDASADPFMRAMGQAFIQDEGAIMQALGSATGMAGGGGGGGGM